MTRLEDLPLKERETISTIWPVKRHLWAQREVLAIRNANAARELAFVTIGRDAPDGVRYDLSPEPISARYIETITSVPGDMFGIEYTWKVTKVHAR